ncbi:hypothetical protein QL285_021985 [Trifolium repens]|nr:hypothetical protein QL285_021985 [Trifolium repens]
MSISNSFREDNLHGLHYFPSSMEGLSSYSSDITFSTLESLSDQILDAIFNGGDFASIPVPTGKNPHFQSSERGNLRGDPHYRMQIDIPSHNRESSTCTFKEMLVVYLKLIGKLLFLFLQIEKYSLSPSFDQYSKYFL